MTRHDNHAVAVMARRTRTRVGGQGVIIDCGRYRNVYDPALIQDPASNTVYVTITPPAYKQDRRLFGGGFYSRKYGN